MIVKSLSEHLDDIHFQFALDEAILKKTGNGEGIPTLRLWRQQRAISLGAIDTHLPFVDKAIVELINQGWDIAVRTCGGACVPLDLGVLNISMIFPLEGYYPNIEESYLAMVSLVKTALDPLEITVEQGEVGGAYCPGKYDLAYQGRKFGGIAQRRNSQAAAVQCFLVVEGVGSERADIAKSFYERACNIHKPIVIPERTISLKEGGKHPISVESVTSLIINKFSEMGPFSLNYEEPTRSELALAKEIMITLKHRTKQYLGENFWL